MPVVPDAGDKDAEEQHHAEDAVRVQLQPELAVAAQRVPAAVRAVHGTADRDRLVATRGVAGRPEADDRRVRQVLQRLDRGVYPHVVGLAVLYAGWSPSPRPACTPARPGRSCRPRTIAAIGSGTGRAWPDVPRCTARPGRARATGPGSASRPSGPLRPAGPATVRRAVPPFGRMRPACDDEPEHQDEVVVAPDVGVAPRCRGSRRVVPEHVHDLRGGRVHQRLHERVGADVRGSRYSTGEVNWKCGRNVPTRPPATVTRNDHASRRISRRCGISLLGQVTGVEQDHRAGQVLHAAGARPRAGGRRSCPGRCPAGSMPRAMKLITTTTRNSAHRMNPGGDLIGRRRQQLRDHRDGQDREDQGAQAERPPQREEQQQRDQWPARW